MIEFLYQLGCFCGFLIICILAVIAFALAFASFQDLRESMKSNRDK